MRRRVSLQPRWLDYIGLPPSELGRDPPGTEFYYLGRPARWLKPEETIEAHDVIARKRMCSDRAGVEDRYLNVLPSFVGAQVGSSRIIRFIYPT